MTMPTNPGSAPSNPMAIERLRTLLNDGIDSAALDGEDGEGYAARVLSVETAVDAVVGLLTSATFIHDVNSAGVPMRRVVAYGEWEIDPNDLRKALAYPAVPKEWDVVRFSVGADRETEWDVIEVRQTQLGNTVVAMVNAAGRGLNGVKVEHLEILRPGPEGHGFAASAARSALDIARKDYAALCDQYDAQSARLRALLADVGPEGDGEDGWSKHAINRVREAYTGRSVAQHEEGKPRAEYDGPRRDDAVAAWLKSKRDQYEPGDPGYFTMDSVLDDYRLHADTGAPLSMPTDKLGLHSPGEV